MPTCFLDVGAVLGVARFWAKANLVYGKHLEDVLIPHDQVRHHTVGASVLLKHREPLLFKNPHDSVSHINTFNIFFKAAWQLING